MNDIKGEWSVAYQDQGLGHGMYGVIAKDTNKVLFEDVTREQAEYAVRHWNSQSDLLVACKIGLNGLKAVLQIAVEFEAKGEVFSEESKSKHKNEIEIVEAAIVKAEK